MDEQWRPIDGYGLRYEVSDRGRVRSNSAKMKGRVLSSCINPRGYPSVGLTINSESRTFVIHRLVATTFVPNPNNLPQINHKNGDKADNRAENLEWTTPSGNTFHWYEMTQTKRVAVTATHIKTGLTLSFASRNAAKAYGFSPGNIWRCLDSPTRFYKGYRWKRAALATHLDKLGGKND